VRAVEWRFKVNSAKVYSNQFQKYNPRPFVEEDIEGHVVSDDGPIMAQWVCRAALQRSVGKLCYTAGFEELQPSAIEVITDLASTYFQNLAKTFKVYLETPKMAAKGAAAEAGEKWQDRYSNDELMLHVLSENGLDLEALESYVKEDTDRMGSKLSTVHERMKAHLADLLRPALGADAGADGAGAFNDGSEQFVGGDFAEDIDEDFFGFKELGLDKEFGLASLQVPLHLLQSKVHTLHQANQQVSGTTTTSLLFEMLPPYEPVTVDNVSEQIGLVRNFFLAKLHANGDQPLIEDEDLPVKQRFPKPRLPPTGKITSPRKRPLKELHGNAKKKKKLDGGGPMDVSPSNGTKLLPPGQDKVRKIRLGILPPSLSTQTSAMERVDSMNSGDDKDVGLLQPLSPDSIGR
jgi:transcriptional activator SPT7